MSITSTLATLLPVYYCLMLNLPPIPEVSRMAMKDTVIVTKSGARQVTSQGLKKLTPAWFSTVLVQSTQTVSNGQKDGAFYICILTQNLLLHTTPYPGLRLGQVWLIFTLPKEYGLFSEPLLYIHWFKPLRTSVPDLEMYNISFASRNHCSHASIVPALHIVQTCHLILHFRHSANRNWVSDSVLDHAPLFYLNPYLWHYGFYHLHYLPDLQHLRDHSQQEVH